MPVVPFKNTKYSVALSFLSENWDLFHKERLVYFP